MFRNRSQKTESVCWLTSCPFEELPPEEWWEKNRLHWGVEAGLHARLEASCHDDKCRLRNTNLLHLHALLPRIANSLSCHWLLQKKKPAQFTTTDFQPQMGEDHDLSTLALVTAKNRKSEARPGPTSSTTNAPDPGRERMPLRAFLHPSQQKTQKYLRETGTTGLEHDPFILHLSQDRPDKNTLINPAYALEMHL